jgi:hypothetical protein
MWCIKVWEFETPFNSAGYAFHSSTFFGFSSAKDRIIEPKIMNLFLVPGWLFQQPIDAVLMGWIPSVVS